MSELKNKFGQNVSWFCLEASVTLKEYQDKDNYTIDDEFEVYGENESGQEGSVNVGVFDLFESAHVALDEKDEEISALTEHLRLKEEECKQLQQDKAELVEALSDINKYMIKMLNSVPVRVAMQKPWINIEHANIALRGGIDALEKQK